MHPSSPAHGSPHASHDLQRVCTPPRPPLNAAFVNLPTNGVIEALCDTLRRPLRGLRTVRIGGNQFGDVARDELRRALLEGPNAASLRLRLKVVSEAEAEAAASAAAIGVAATEDEAAKGAAAADGTATEGKEATLPAVMDDAELGLVSLARMGRPGTWAPEPSLIRGGSPGGSVSSLGSLMARELEASGYFDAHTDAAAVDSAANGDAGPNGKPLMATQSTTPQSSCVDGGGAAGDLPASALRSASHLSLPTSLSRSAMQSAALGFSGARVTAQMVDPA